jgi:pimeloyl-ACP methyl ester carboxylesterase
VVRLATWAGQDLCIVSHSDQSFLVRSVRGCLFSGLFEISPGRSGICVANGPLLASSFSTTTVSGTRILVESVAMNRYQWMAVLSVMGFALGPASAASREAEPIRLETFDQVVLRGWFWSSSQPKRDPTVILLHEPGREPRDADWKALAGQLQAKGYSVLYFHFRGHGDSTEVGQGFWDQPLNTRFIRGANRKPDVVTWESFSSRYWPMLAHDVAAARAFLDLKNDSGDCHSSRLLLIGVGDGITLGLQWLASESRRFNSITNLFGEKLATQSEATGTIGLVGIGLRSSLGDRSVPVLEWVSQLQKHLPTRMALLYHPADTSAAGVARSCERQTAKSRLVVHRPLQALSPTSEPLITQPGVQAAILKYADFLKEAEVPGPWRVREAHQNRCYWLPVRGAAVLAKLENEAVPRQLPADWLPIR